MRDRRLDQDRRPVREQDRPTGSRQPKPPERTSAEWTTLIISSLIVAGVLGLLIYDLIAGRNTPPQVVVISHFDEVRFESGKFYLPVTLYNEGGRTAEDVTASFDLVIDDEATESASFTVRFLAPGERDEGVLLFDNDPTSGELFHTVSFVRP